MIDYDPNYVSQKNPFLLGVKVLIINENNEALLLWRSDKVSRPHGIDLPGGAVDAHEGPDDAAVREVLEETGIVIDAPRLVCSEYMVHDGVDVVVLGYTLRISGTAPVVALSWEHEAYEWRAIEGIDTTQLMPLQQKLLKSLQ